MVLGNLDQGTRKLIFILCLPLIDGVFPTLLVTGAVSTFSDILAIAITIFAGAGALAVLYSYSDSVRDAQRMVIQSAPLLLAGVFLTALVAPIFEQLFYIERLRYAAGLALIIIGAQLAEVSLSESIPASAIIIAGMTVSVKNPSAFVINLGYVAPALATAIASLTLLYLATFLRNIEMSITRLQRGSAIVLFTVSLSMFGFNVPTELGLAIFGGAFIMSLQRPDISEINPFYRILEMINNGRI